LNVRTKISPEVIGVQKHEDATASPVADTGGLLFAHRPREKNLTGFSALRCDDETAGVATFVTTLRSGGVVRERMESLDHAERCMKYRVLDAGPLPYANYRGEARVQPCGTDACVVSFQCSFIPVDASEHDARQHWLDHNHKVLETLREFVEGRRSV